MVNLGALVAIWQEERILLTKRDDVHFWCIPGGHVDEGESIAQAAVREAFEETGLVVRLTRLVGAYSRLGGIANIHIVLFSATPIGGTLRLQPNETIEAKFFDLAALPADLIFGHHQMILDTADSSGKPAAWQQSIQFPPSLQHLTSRAELYSAIQNSDLLPEEFYRRILTESVTQQTREL